MQTYELIVDRRSLRVACEDTTVVRTSVGVDRIHVLFDDAEWLGFPITATFSQDGVRPVTQQMSVTSVSGSECRAEGYATIPSEVTRKVGPIRVTIQGTDSSGNHIVTAKAAPLSVEESGDVTMGEIPEDAPTVDQWTQAYNMTMDAVARANEAIAALESAGIATVGTLGMVMPDGSTITIESDGTISSVQYELPAATYESLGGVMPDGTTITVDENGVISGANSYVLPMATGTTLGGVIPDGVTITIDDEGVIHGTARYVLPHASSSVLGGMKVGDGLTIDSSGTVSINYFTDAEIDEATPLDEYILNGDEVWY